MPPKRKTGDSRKRKVQSSESNQMYRKNKSKRNGSMVGTLALHASTNNINESVSSRYNGTKADSSTSKLKEWFEKYKDKEDEEGNITAEGIGQLCKNLQIDSDSVLDTFILSNLLGLSKLGYISYSEWEAAMLKLSCTNEDNLEVLFQSHKADISESKDKFLEFYRWAFKFIQSPETKKVDVKVFKYVIPHIVGTENSHVEKFVAYLDHLEEKQEEKPASSYLFSYDTSDKITGINKDQWNMFYQFINSIKDDGKFLDYDFESSCE
ncbi:DCN1-like protein 5 [Mycoemilia scoparia]|uniref:Defective in cullin neddylation protein n=1 Tax=Mycoemilia scoparia TaxID=417184 RepID=A0A9W8A171_9FUNG|nr:DCN1-like protein 5 [Mycoemilia scoparia]